ncbi:MAG: hypothetical protein GY716_02685 [bacterium]|nr:hypothetical protein [bacterium]
MARQTFVSVLLFVLLPVGAFHAGTAILSTTQDGAATGTASGVFNTFDPNVTAMLISRQTTNNLQRRTILEFDLSTIPLDLTLTEAKLTFRVIQTVSPGITVEVHAHVGDNVLEIADATRPDNLLGSLPINQLGFFDIPLDTAFIESLRNSASPEPYLELRLSPPPTQTGAIAIASLESVLAGEAQLSLVSPQIIEPCNIRGFSTTEDGEAFGTADGVYTSFDPTEWDMNVTRHTSNNTSYRTVLEFDLDDVPLDAEILDAMLTFRVVQLVSPGMTVEVHAQTGDGMLELADGSRPDNLIGVIPINTLGFFDVPLGTAFIEALRDSALPSQFLELRLSPPFNLTGSIAIAALESTLAGEAVLTLTTPQLGDLDRDEICDLDDPDDDGDGCPDVADPAPLVASGDPDGDAVGADCDNCLNDFNPDQDDADADGEGNICDTDDDGDGVLDDGDGSGTIGDNPCTGGNTTGCDDNCQFVANADQTDGNANGVGSACETICEIVVGAPGPPVTDFATVADALAATSGAPPEPVVVDGCLIRVLPGTYTGSLLLDRFLTLQAVGDSSNTTIDGDGAADAVEVSDRQVPGVTRLRGFTVRDATDGIDSERSLVLEDVRVDTISGVGVSLGLGDHLLDGVSVLGGDTGIRLETFAAATMNRIEVRGTSTTALDLDGVVAGHTHLIVDNAGTGILIGPEGDVELSFATVAGNAVGVHELFLGSTQMGHSIVCLNTDDIDSLNCSDFDFSNVCETDCSGDGDLDCTFVEGNISGDPLFVGAASGDYRLTPASPSVDAGQAPQCFDGTPCFDLDDNPRLLDADGDESARPDMGAYELDNSANLDPGDVTGLQVVFSPSLQLSWSPEPSSSFYHVYEGQVSTLGYDYDLSCLGATTGTTFAVPGLPPAGETTLYLVTGDGAAEEGTLGFGTCAERSNIVDPCP